MKTLKQLSLFILTASAASVMAQGDPAPAAPAGNGGSDGVSWHPNADPKWPAGKDQVKADSGAQNQPS